MVFTGFFRCFFLSFFAFRVFFDFWVESDLNQDRRVKQRIFSQLRGIEGAMPRIWHAAMAASPRGTQKYGSAECPIHTLTFGVSDLLPLNLAFVTIK